jgi:hypothetical protein
VLTGLNFITYKSKREWKVIDGEVKTEFLCEEENERIPENIICMTGVELNCLYVPYSIRR